MVYGIDTVGCATLTLQRFRDARVSVLNLWAVLVMKADKKHVCNPVCAAGAIVCHRRRWPPARADVFTSARHDNGDGGTEGM